MCARLSNTVAVSSEPANDVEKEDLPLQPASADIWDVKYRLKDKQGQAVDQSIEDTWRRVARSLADVEAPENQEFWYQRFVWALAQGAIPAGRIMSNAGAEAYKPATSTINCTVSGTIPDSMNGILSMVKEAGLTLKAGCGIGYEFSTLRPKGAYVTGAGAYTSGPLSFMDIFDSMCFTVSSAGGRRGAQMGTFDISHPDVIDFIRAKRENGRLRQFNLSCLITRDFMEAVKNDTDWDLVFPASASEVEDTNNTIVWKHLPHYKTNNVVRNDKAQVACRVYKTIKARRLWDVIMASTYDYAEPGFILIDEVNEMNNNWFCEDVRATNPCGEQPLPPYGACLLGSVNLTKFVRHPFTDKAFFDWDAYREVVSVFTRMLDNVVEVNGLPLPGQRDEIMRKRRHGMGFLGLGSALSMLRVPYGSPDSLVFTEKVSYEMARTGFRVGIDLAAEKGVAPVMEEEFEVTTEMLAKRPELAADGIKLGDKLKGRVLWAKYSRYMQKFASTGNAEDVAMLDALIEKGCRFTHHSSIAPTGTISLSLANNASNGIEPSFAHHYARNIIREGKKSKEKVDDSPMNCWLIAS